MVNELNRPQNGDNAALSERLAASNRQLQEMQEEHRQLLQEMETLRLRAAELTRLNAQRQQLRQSAGEEEQSQVEAPAEPEPVPSSSSPADLATEEATPPVQEEGSNDDDEDKEETASYLQQKLNEIANLKAQFKRVQHMVDTTNLIEQHMSSRQTVQVQSSSSVQSSRQTTTSEVRVAEGIEAGQETASPSTTAAPDNAELLNSMLNMFTDFTSDLRGQAESLRAERDRIRTLKEDIIQRKQGK
ncbi:uncharacterized protein LOC128257187 [Drosophila gunungcola]|uniref:Uncharacterized protein n=1 Tax=Drosophila gunungcola TaxID=103775 RepID=A0A9Q0BQN1_9MUSC|nr:uncharacterized protein LOC128257187 [Drosophila gunungcola]XP_052844024.1 uncharacterized protein LOC128257187 [Drosophila gunungcola]KAI8041162.1 hypothetical protein M5D96_005414 [Drosophila gunungcola]